MKNRPINRFVIPLISVLFILAAGIFMRDDLFTRRSEPEIEVVTTPAPIPVTVPTKVVIVTPEPVESAEPEETDNLPHDRLFITVERQQYVQGDMRLVIPRLSLDKSVGNGTTQDDLSYGPCLYDYAQLPGTGNRNVSIAGHRIYQDFYYLDEMTELDYLYLVWDGSIYRYIYESTTVVEQDDWGPIYSQGYSLVTLTTCTPIGISDHRMIVRFTLDEIFEYADDFVFDTAAPAVPASAPPGAAKGTAPPTASAR